MYLTASDGLDLFPDECLFVDDNPAFVAAAFDLGFDGLALVRDAWRRHAPDMSCITTLDELLAHFDEARTSGGGGPLERRRGISERAAEHFGCGRGGDTHVGQHGRGLLEGTAGRGRRSPDAMWAATRTR